jgi:hypothetical protein
MEICDVALGFVYSYLIISIDIRIHAICLGIHVLHWDTYHRIGICDNALSDDRDSMSSHLPHGPLRFILLAQCLQVVSWTIGWCGIDHHCLFEERPP